MERTCSKCNYSNSSTSHYCVKCGAPLEKEKDFLFLGMRRCLYKKYEVIAKTELEALRNERNRLRKQINDSWGIKVENWIKDNKNTIGWTIASIFAIIFVGMVIIKCDFSTKASEVIEIRKDEVSGKYAIYNNESKTLVTPYEYDSISHRKGMDYQGVYRNFFYLYKNWKIGVADSTGKTTVNCELDGTEGAYSGVIILKKGEKQGLMDIFGHQIIPCEYQYILWENETEYSSLEHPGRYVGNILPVKADKNGGWELYNRSGRKIRGQRYKAAIQTGNPRLIKVRENRNDYKVLYGIVDENGQVIIPCKYYSISVFGNDRAWARQNYGDSWSLITSKGERLMTLPKGLTPSAFHDGMAAVTEKGKIGYCDTLGKFVIPINFERVRNNDGSYVSYDFYNGKARVIYNGKTGYVDKIGTFTPDMVK